MMADIHSLQLDGSGGARVTGIAEATWRCMNTRLRSLDVADSPALTTLDLADASGLVWQHFPKGTDFRQVTDGQLRKVVKKLNE